MSVNLLLEAGANPTHKDGIQYSILHYAAMHCNSGQLVRCLIAAGAEVNGRDCYGGTPLFHAASYKNVYTARALLDNGASLEIYDSTVHSILNQALFDRAKKVLRLLLKRGAPRTSRNLAGQSILHAAALYTDLECLEVLRSANLTGMDPDAKDLKESTPLQLAQKRERIPEGFIQKLQELLAEICARNTIDAIGSSTRESVGGDTSRRPSFFNLGSFQARTRIRSTTRPSWKSMLLY